MSTARARTRAAVHAPSRAASRLAAPRARISVRVQPRASRTSFDGVVNGVLRVRLQAPPVDGAANEALIRVLADSLGVARRQVRIVAGHSSRNKIVEIEGIERVDVERLLPSSSL